jgi:hypothetical protein
MKSEVVKRKNISITQNKEQELLTFISDNLQEIYPNIASILYKKIKTDIVKCNEETNIITLLNKLQDKYISDQNYNIGLISVLPETALHGKYNLELENIHLQFLINCVNNVIEHYTNPVYVNTYLKVNPLDFGFDDLEKVKKLKKYGISTFSLINEISVKHTVVYTIALFSYLGFIYHLEEYYRCHSNNDLSKKLVPWFPEATDTNIRLCITYYQNDKNDERDNHYENNMKLVLEKFEL